MAEEPGRSLTPFGGSPLNQLLSEQTLRKLGLVIGLALAIAGGIWLFMWAKEPVYRPLYGKLSQQDASAVVDALQASGIQYQLESGTGVVLVPAADVDKARLQLASQGLPQSSGNGFEMLSKDQGFGTSQFMENARFHRALETELARTIASIQGVEGVRVHLAIPKQSVFVRERNAPSASVMMTLHPGRTLTDGQVAGIVHLVASSVPDLPHENVTVVDQRGRLLTRGDDVLGATTAQLEYKQQIEENYVRRIENLLAPMLGADRIRAQVNARLNFTAEESTQEAFDPQGQVLRSEQSSEQRALDGKPVGGVPGALTNQPPEAGTLAPPGAAPAGAAAAAVDARTTNLNTTATRNYEITKTVRHTRGAVGKLERLSVAVLVDQKEVKDADGKITREPLSEQEITQLTGLIREAVGFDEQRGDTINLISAAFKPVEQAEPIEVPLTQQPWLWEVGKLVVAAILGLVLLFKGVLPIVRSLTAKPTPPPAPVGLDGQPMLAGADGLPQLTGPQVAQMAAQQQRQLPGAAAGTSYEDSLTTARQVVAQEPAAAASVVKNWLSEDE